MCGGTLEISTCSHVGHVFRKSTPYTFPGGTSKIVNKNNARLAEVWLDDWKEFYYSINPGQPHTAFTFATPYMLTTHRCSTHTYHLCLSIQIASFFHHPMQLRLHTRYVHRFSNFHKNMFLYTLNTVISYTLNTAKIPIFSSKLERRVSTAKCHKMLLL